MTGVLCLGLCALLLAGASAERLLLQGSNCPMLCSTAKGALLHLLVCISMLDAPTMVGVLLDPSPATAPLALDWPPVLSGPCARE